MNVATRISVPHAEHAVIDQENRHLLPTG